MGHSGKCECVVKNEFGDRVLSSVSELTVEGTYVCNVISELYGSKRTRLTTRLKKQFKIYRKCSLLKC